MRGEAASDSSEISGARRVREGTSGVDKGRERLYSREGGRNERQREDRRREEWGRQEKERERVRAWERGRERERMRRDSDSGSGERSPRRDWQEFGEAPSLSQSEREHWNRNREDIGPLWSAGSSRVLKEANLSRSQTRDSPHVEFERSGAPEDDDRGHARVRPNRDSSPRSQHQFDSLRERRASKSRERRSSKSPSNRARFSPRCYARFCRQELRADMERDGI